MKIFYDTSALLEETNFENIIISSITLSELEKIKTSESKSQDIKVKARKLLRWLDENKDKYEVIIFKPYFLEAFKSAEDFRISTYGITNDFKILATAVYYENTFCPDNMLFATNDLNLKLIANLFFGEDSIISVHPKENKYRGYKEIYPSHEELSYFYSNKDKNIYDLKINEYLIIYDKDTIIDKYKWNGITHEEVHYISAHSYYFGEIKPYKNDVYQLLALDSLKYNQVTMLCGKPGTGKTWLGLGYLFSELEKNKIDRIIIFCNPVVAKDAAKLGFYPGERGEKILSSQVGNILASKLGSMYAVEQLIKDEKIVLIPCGDARGYEVPPKSGVYIMEAQNYTKDLMRMLLQRIGEESQVIIDGDYTEQVDLDTYQGENNGMIKASEIFRGQDFYGQIELPIIHRSRIAYIADLIR